MSESDRERELSTYLGLFLFTMGLDFIKFRQVDIDNFKASQFSGLAIERQPGQVTLTLLTPKEVGATQKVDLDACPTKGVM